MPENTYRKFAERAVEDATAAYQANNNADLAIFTLLMQSLATQAVIADELVAIRQHLEDNHSGA